MAAIYRRYEESTKESGRAHLGASMIGRECRRQLWYGFRWATAPSFPGRVLRLFKRGHDEEDFFIKDLVAIGVQVWAVDANGNQFGCTWHGDHFAGSCDGVAKGLPESPNKAHLLEFKTHNHKSYAQLVKHGVEKSKPEHFAQMQVYMHGLELDRAMYMAVCKDTDELYAERIKYDKALALALVEKAKNIIATDTPPPGISAKAEFYKCKFCDHADVCHRGALPDVSCRTCIHAFADLTGGWKCCHHDRVITTSEQRQGCGKHLYLPDLVPHEMVDMDPDANRILYRTNAGVEFYNGEKGDKSYTSQELHAAPAGLLGDPTADKLRATFNGEFAKKDD